MKRIYKYKLGNSTAQKIKIPSDYKIIFFEDDKYQEPCIWVEVIPENEEVEETFAILPTGAEVYENSIHIGSFQRIIGEEIFTFHAYKRGQE